MKLRCSRLNMRRLVQHIGTFNDRKFGKHRRGTVRLDAVNWSDGVAEIVFAYNRPRWFAIYDPRTNRTYRFQQHCMTNFSKLLKTLHTPDSTDSLAP